jgi:hypothetical protein
MTATAALIDAITSNPFVTFDAITPAAHAAGVDRKSFPNIKKSILCHHLPAAEKRFKLAAEAHELYPTDSVLTKRLKIAEIELSKARSRAENALGATEVLPDEKTAHDSEQQQPNRLTDDWRIDMLKKFAEHLASIATGLTPINPLDSFDHRLNFSLESPDFANFIDFVVANRKGKIAELYILATKAIAKIRTETAGLATVPDDLSAQFERQTQAYKALIG